MAGVSPPAGWAGRDLAAALRDPKAILEDAFSEWADEKSEAWGGFAFRSVRTPRHKLIVVWRDADRAEFPPELAAPEVARPGAAEIDDRGKARGGASRTFSISPQPTGNLGGVAQPLSVPIIPAGIASGITATRAARARAEGATARA